jgi:hypothetical protein
LPRDRRCSPLSLGIFGGSNWWPEIYIDEPNSSERSMYLLRCPSSRLLSTHLINRRKERVDPDYGMALPGRQRPVQATSSPAGFVDGTAMWIPRIPPIHEVA